MFTVPSLLDSLGKEAPSNLHHHFEGKATLALKRCIDCSSLGANFHVDRSFQLTDGPG